MAKRTSFFLDLFVLFLLILLVKYAYQLFQKPDQTPPPLEDFTAESINQAADAASRVYFDAHKEPVPQDRQHLSEKTQKLLAVADTLIHQLHQAQAHISHDIIMEQKDRDEMVADIKATISQIDHVIHEFVQEPARTEQLLGPNGSSTRLVFERSLQQKLVACAQKAEIIFIRLYNELQGAHKPLTPAASLHVCVANIKKLNTELSW